MKHLKSYKLFESVDEIKSTITDILRDNVLDKDIHFKIHTRKYTDINYNNPVEVIKIQIGDDFEDYVIRVDELKEDIKTITSYLESEGYKYNTFSYQDENTEIKGDMGDVVNSVGLETNYLSLFYKKEIRDTNPNSSIFSHLENVEIKFDRVTKIVNDYIKECKWDIQNSIGNCSFFAKDFYEWCQSKGIDCKLIYLKQDEDFVIGDEIEDHIAPMVDEQLIDFVYTPTGVSRRVRQNSPDAIQRQLSPEITQKNDIVNKYGYRGYNTIEEVSYEEAYQGNNKKCKTIDYPNRLNETIKVPIEVGDTVLGGRFKNKKMVVKKIGKNKKGDITINDKPLLKFRLVKESLQEDVDYYFRHLEDDNFLIQVSDDYFRIFKPKTGTFYSYSNCNPFKWSEIAGEIDRYVNELDDSENSEKSIDYVYVVKSEGGSANRKQIHPRMLLDETFDAGKILSFTIGFK